MYKEISREDAVQLASEWQKRGDTWHFHMLPPTCCFSPDDTHRHVLLLENSTTNATFMLCTSSPDMNLGRQFAQQVHALVFASISTHMAPAPWFDEWRLRIASLKERGIGWHHHMLLPNCVLNLHEPNWVLVLEGDDGTPALVRANTTEPTAEFCAIEREVWGSAN